MSPASGSGAVSAEAAVMAARKAPKVRYCLDSILMRVCEQVYCPFVNFHFPSYEGRLPRSHLMSLVDSTC